MTSCSRLFASQESTWWWSGPAAPNSPFVVGFRFLQSSHFVVRRRQPVPGQTKECSPALFGYKGLLIPAAALWRPAWIPFASWDVQTLVWWPCLWFGLAGCPLKRTGWSLWWPCRTSEASFRPLSPQGPRNFWPGTRTASLSWSEVSHRRAWWGPLPRETGSCRREFTRACSGYQLRTCWQVLCE